MREGYKLLGNYIRQVDERNIEGTEDNLLGVSVQKVFIPSIANTNGTDFTKYKIVKKRQFTYIPDTSRRGDKIAIALLEDYDEGLVSNVYTVFEVIDENKLLPEYLMLWFMRPEFDRYARFKSHGSVREVMDWDEMCKVSLPIPSIERQREIVKAYRALTDRIELKRKINDNLEAQALALFEEQFASAYSASDLPEGWRKQRLDTICTVKGGKRLPADAELLDDPTEHPYIRVRDVGASRYVCLTDQFQYIDDETHQAIARYIVDTDDIVISIVGTIGLIGKIHSTLNKANLTENCVRLTGVKGVTPDYLYYTLCMKKNNREIELLTVGAVQAKLPMYNIQSIDIIIPPDDLIRRFQDRMDIFNSQIEANSLETQRLEELRNVLLAKISD